MIQELGFIVDHSKRSAVKSLLDQRLRLIGMNCGQDGVSEKVSCSSKVDRAYPTAAFSDSITYHHSRRDREMVVALLCYHDSSSDSSSSEEHDLELLLLDLTETPKRSFGPRLNL